MVSVTSERDIMSRIKNMSRGGYILVGFLVAMLLVPSGVAVAKALKFTGVQGTSGQRADVTGASQLLATEASPANYYANGNGLFSNFGGNFIDAAPGSGHALIVKSVDLDTQIFTAPPGTNTYVFLFVGDSTCTDDFLVLNFVNITSFGTLHLSYEPGVSIPDGEALCSVGSASSGALSGTTTVVGYQVPSTDVPAAAVSSGQPVSQALARHQAAMQQHSS
jgi:hypothetical protein